MSYLIFNKNKKNKKMEKDVQQKPNQKKKKLRLQNEIIDKVIIYNII